MNLFGSEDPRGAASAEPLGVESSHVHVRPQVTEAGDEEEENHCRHQEDGQAGPDRYSTYSGRPGSHLPYILKFMLK